MQRCNILSSRSPVLITSAAHKQRTQRRMMITAIMLAIFAVAIKF